MHITIAVVTYVIVSALIDYFLDEREVTFTSVATGFIISIVLYGNALDSMLLHPSLYSSACIITLFTALVYRARHSEAVESGDVVDAVFCRTVSGIASGLYPILLGVMAAGAFYDQ